MPSDAVFDLLQACLKQKNLVHARQIYCKVIDNGLDSSLFFRDHLIRLFALCGSLLESNKVFGVTGGPSVFTWNAIISAHAHAGEGQKALKLYIRMKEEGVTPNRVTYLSILKVCLNLNDLDQGRLIHMEINASKWKLDMVLGNALIDTYAKFQSLDEALEVFENMCTRDVVSWGAIISGYTQNGLGVLALQLFKEMQSEGVKPDRVIYTSVLKATGQIGALEVGRLLHAQVLTSGQEFSSDLVIGNTLVDIYGKCGSMEDAQVVFNGLANQDVVSWDALIAGFANNGFEDAVFEVFEKMHSSRVNPGKATYLCVLKACASGGSTFYGRKVHDEILKSDCMLDLELGNTLVDMYAKCGNLCDAQRVFDLLGIRDGVSWSALIVGYANHGHEYAVLELFEKMQEGGVYPSEIIVSLVLKACGSMGALEHGRLLHRRISENFLAWDRVVHNTLIDMYVKCGNLKEAQKAFDEVPTKDVVSWGSIIAGNAQHGQSFHALELFGKMQQQGVKPNGIIFSSVLKASGDLRATREGMLIHSQVIQCGCDSNLVVGNTLVDMYSKCASLDDAWKVFESLQCRDVVSWTTMIAGYVQHEYGFYALGVFARMLEQGETASRVIFLHVSRACGMVGAIDHSRLVHSQIVEAELESDVAIGNTLIDMYGKCGSIDDARQVFNSLSGRDGVTWTSMITGYANCGSLSLAWHLLEDMRKHGLEPDDVIFSNILSACSNFGLLEEGRLYFQYMREKFEVKPSLEHYSCIVDLLARAGGLDEAGDLVSTLPVSPDPVVWRSLLSNSKTYENLDVARHSVFGIVEQGPLDASGFVLMSKCSANAQLWEGFSRTQQLNFSAGIQEKAEEAWIGESEKTRGFHDMPQLENFMFDKDKEKLELEEALDLPSAHHEEGIIQTVENLQRQNKCCNLRNLVPYSDSHIILIKNAFEVTTVEPRGCIL